MIEACTVQCELRSSCNPLFKNFKIIVQAQNRNQARAHKFSSLVHSIKGSTKLKVFGGKKSLMTKFCDLPFDKFYNSGKGGQKKVNQMKRVKWGKFSDLRFF